MRSNRLRALAAFVLLCLGVGALGALATFSSIQTWYATLHKPGFNPPNWIFGPVWTVLYIAMGIAAWLIWNSPRSQARTMALRLWGVQLALNALWTPVFFGLHHIGAALGVIIALDLALLMLIANTWLPFRAAALLLMPYLAWTFFATALNTAIFRLNR